MKAKDLKNSILQMAIEGKLVPQDPSDEPASVLLERIREEKHKLIAEGKAKFPKGGESIIYIGSDGSPYEKRVDAKGRVTSDKCITNEVPFEELPEGWAWARLSMLTANVHYGYTCSSSSSGHIKLLRITDIQNGHVNWDTVPYCASDPKDRSTYLLKEGDILIARTGGTIGKSYFISEKPPVSAFASYLIRAIPIKNEIVPYFRSYFDSPSYWAQLIDASAGTGQPNVNAASIGRLLIALPPLAEQRRIVERVNELMPLGEEYGGLEDAREALDAVLPGRLRKSVLQLAVRGGLVPQDPADEPAAVLLERIRGQRRQLVAEGKMKAPKGGESIIFAGSDGRRYEKRVDAKGRESEPACIEDELPFEIPEGWEWARLETLGTIIGGGTPKTGVSEFWSDEASGIPWITPADMGAQPNVFISAGKRFISNVGLEKSSAQLLPTGSVLMSSRAPIGYLGIAANPIATNQGFKSVALIDNAMNRWLICVLEAIMDSIAKRASGTTFKEISGSEFGKTLVPLPPAEEQTRILSSFKRLSIAVTNQ